jgi:radical SAM-linked protein
VKVRFRFAKLGKVRWTSHRDVARMWERALRRAALPVAHTGGFTPRPKISFGLALPTGHESLAEYLDVEFERDGFDVDYLPARVTSALPAGIDVTAAAVVDDRGSSLQESVTSCTWEVEAVGAPVDEVEALVEQALAATSIVVTRERKGATVTDDVRPSILTATVMGPPPCLGDGYADHDPGALVVAELGAHPRSLRPVEFLRALSPGLREGHVRRTHQWIVRDGARREPLPLGATDAPHAKVACA